MPAQTGLSEPVGSDGDLRSDAEFETTTAPVETRRSNPIFQFGCGALALPISLHPLIVAGSRVNPDQGGCHPAKVRHTEPFQFTLNGHLKVGLQGSRVTSDTGLILMRELDDRLALAGIIAADPRDSRHGLNTPLRLPGLLRQSAYSRASGYDDLSDALRFSTEPTFRPIGSPARWNRSVAPTSTRQSLTVLRQRLVKTDWRSVKHAWYYWLILAKSHLTRRLFGAMLQRIWALPVPAG